MRARCFIALVASLAFLGLLALPMLAFLKALAVSAARSPVVGHVLLGLAAVLTVLSFGLVALLVVLAASLACGDGGEGG